MCDGERAPLKRWNLITLHEMIKWVLFFLTLQFNIVPALTAWIEFGANDETFFWICRFDCIHLCVLYFVSFSSQINKIRWLIAQYEYETKLREFFIFSSSLVQFDFVDGWWAKMGAAFLLIDYRTHTHTIE